MVLRGTSVVTVGSVGLHRNNVSVKDVVGMKHSMGYPGAFIQVASVQPSLSSYLCPSPSLPQFNGYSGVFFGQCTVQGTLLLSYIWVILPTPKLLQNIVTVILYQKAGRHCPPRISPCLTKLKAWPDAGLPNLLFTHLDIKAI